MIDIRQEAIYKAMEMQNIEDKKDCFSKVLSIFQLYQKEINVQGVI